MRIVQRAATWLGMGRQWQAVAEAPSLEAQRAAWNRQAERGVGGAGCLNRLTAWWWQAEQRSAVQQHKATCHCSLQPLPLGPFPHCRSLWLVRLLHAAPSWLLSVIADVAALLCFNRITLWCAGGAGRCWAAPGVCRRGGCVTVAA